METHMDSFLKVDANFFNFESAHKMCHASHSGSFLRYQYNSGQWVINTISFNLMKRTPSSYSCMHKIPHNTTQYQAIWQRIPGSNKCHFLLQCWSWLFCQNNFIAYWVTLSFMIFCTIQPLVMINYKFVKTNFISYWVH